MTEQTEKKKKKRFPIQEPMTEDEISEFSRLQLVKLRVGFHASQERWNLSCKNNPMDYIR